MTAHELLDDPSTLLIRWQEHADVNTLDALLRREVAILKERIRRRQGGVADRAILVEPDKPGVQRTPYSRVRGWPAPRVASSASADTMGPSLSVGAHRPCPESDGAMRFTPAILLASCMLGPALPAQTPLPDSDKQKTVTKKKAPIDFELPDAEKRVERAPSTPEDLVHSLVDDLANYPAGRAERAMDQLVLAGPAVAGPLREVLNGIRFEPRVPAALVLSRLGDEAAIAGIEKLIVDPRAKQATRVLLDGLEEIDSRRAREVALGHANGKSPALRSAALRYLAVRVAHDEAVAAGLRELLDSDVATTRKRAYELLARGGSADLLAESMNILGDRDSQLAERAMNYVIQHKNDDTVAVLVDLARKDPPDRRSMWALITLAEIEDRHGETLLTEDLVPVLRPRLRSLDPLVRVTAGIGLAQIAARSEADGMEDLLAGEVLPALMESFLRNEYFRDFLPLFAVAAPRVQRITGFDLGTDLGKWRQAWLGEQGAPMIRRDLDPADLPDLADRVVLWYERRGLLALGADREVVLAGPRRLDLPTDADLEGVLYVDEATMSGLVNAILEADLLGQGRRSSIRGLEHTGYRRLVARDDNRERAVVVGGESDQAFEEVERLLVEEADRRFWQRLYVGDPAGFAAYYRENDASHAPDVEPRERDRRLLQALQVALPALPSDLRIEGLSALWRRAIGRDLLDIDELRVLLYGLEDEPVPEGAPAVLAQIVIDSGNKALFSPYAEYVARRFGSEGDGLLRRMIEGLDAVDEALHDARPQVRIAGARVAAETGHVNSGRLLAALDDSDPRVVREAILAMGRSRDGQVRDRLLAMARGDGGALRRVAIESIGAVGTVESFELLRGAAESDDAALALAAYRGLARVGDAASIQLLDEAIARHGVQNQNGLNALDALVEVGSDAARHVLVRYAGSDVPELREEAAYRLARLHEMRAVPVLLEILDTPARAGRALELLSVLLCCDGGSRGEHFVQRYRDEPDLDADEWLRRALEVPDFVDGADAVRGTPVASLVAGLRDPRWYVRVNVIGRLEEQYDVSFGSPLRYASDGDIDVLALRWERFLATPVRARSSG